jgi:hypothetical protein
MVVRPGTGFSGRSLFLLYLYRGKYKGCRSHEVLGALRSSLLSLSLARQARLGLGCSPFYLLTYYRILEVARSINSIPLHYLFGMVNETIMATATSQDIISPLTTEKPELIVSAPSINSEPVELDSTPASPDKVRTRRASRDELLAELDEEEKEVSILAAGVLTLTVAKM